MYKKKEYWIIGIIIAVSLVLAFLPMMISSSGDEEEELVPETTETKKLCITIKGEIRVSELQLEIPYGYSYGYIITKIEPYLNGYSVVSKERTKRYYESCTIYIESSDTNYEKTEEVSETEGKININTATVDILTSLYGIGEKRAEAIVEYRKTKTIESFEELKSLLGVSDEIIAGIKEKAVL